MKFSKKANTVTEDKSAVSKDTKVFVPTEEQELCRKLANENDAMKIEAIAGSGKEQPVWCKVQTPYGERYIGDLKVGDEVFGKDGKPTKVTGVFPQGKKDVYKFTFRDGSETYAGYDHLWLVKSINWNRKPRFEVKSTQWILNHGLKHKSGNYKLQIPLCEPVEYAEKDLPVDPYVLGCLIADGSLTGSSLQFSYNIKDSWIKDKLSKNLPKGIMVGSDRCTGGLGYQCTLVREDKTKLKNPLKLVLENLKLDVTSKFKKIPIEYLHGSVMQRIQLLQGLMDCDGSCTNNRTSYTTSSEQLVKDVKTLVQSLGGTCTVYQGKAERKGQYQLNVKVNFNPFSLERKARNWKPSKKNPPSRYIFKVEKLEDKCEQVCISVENEESLYLTDEFVVTHNTSVLFYISESLKVPSMYVAFNKNMADEASEKFSSHVECKTMHSLAYRYVGHSYQHKLSRPVGKYRNVAGTGREIATYFKIPDFDVPSDSGMRKYVSKFYIGQIIKDTVSKFESSADDTLKGKHIPHHHEKDLKDRFGKKLDMGKFKNLLLRFADRLWEERIDKFSEVLCTHDTYLKLYQLSKPTIPDIEVLYCDEQQDSSDCFLDIIFNQKQVKRILVGDSRQAIYAWRGAVNAMKKVNYKKATLSKSFRYGDRIAKVATAVLRNKVKIQGLETLDTKVGDDVVDFDKPYTILFRTNTNLVFKAIDLLSSGESVSINIDVKDFVEMVRSAEALHDGIMNKVKHEAIVPYTTWEEFTEEAEYTREFKRILRIVEDGDTDKVISTLHRHKNSKSAKVTLTTSHKAKGLEFSQVVLSDCFPSIYNSKGEYVGLREEEENLLYVAVTRATEALQLNSTTKEILEYNGLSEEML